MSIQTKDSVNNDGTWKRRYNDTTLYVRHFHHYEFIAVVYINKKILFGNYEVHFHFVAHTHFVDIDMILATYLKAIRAVSCFSCRYFIPFSIFSLIHTFFYREI